VRVDGDDKPLTGYQFTLLLTLAERAGRVLTRDALMDLMKGEKLEAFDRSVDIHVSRIRAAIEDDPKRPKRIADGARHRDTSSPGPGSTEHPPGVPDRSEAGVEGLLCLNPLLACGARSLGYARDDG
jgi:hypothetical protein